MTDARFVGSYCRKLEKDTRIEVSEIIESNIFHLIYFQIRIVIIVTRRKGGRGRLIVRRVETAKKDHDGKTKDEKKNITQTIKNHTQKHIRRGKWWTINVIIPIRKIFCINSSKYNQERFLPST